MKSTTIFSILLLAVHAVPSLANATAAGAAMPGAHIIRSSGTFIVKPNTNWSSQTGFGSNAAGTAMMIKMMVSGSGMQAMQGMNMTRSAGKAQEAASAANGLNAVAELQVNPPAAGSNLLKLTVMQMDGKPAAELPLTISTAMDTMDMGTKVVQVRTDARGVCSVPVQFAMNGPWTIQVRSDPKNSPPLSLQLHVNAGSRSKWVQPAYYTLALTPEGKKVIVGQNKLKLLCTKNNGTPAAGMQINIEIAMSGMDMGTTRMKSVTDKSGSCILPVNFAMAGSWQVKIMAVQPGSKPLQCVFTFEAKG